MTQLPSILKARQLLRAGELQPLELVEQCLATTEKYEDQVHAWVMVDEDGARRQAEHLAESLRRGRHPGPLHGIPIGIKDLIDVEGWPTKAGSPLRADHIAQHDAPLVTQLREAGAIILGKTVTTEFASFDPPPTRNPWNLAHTPGGSSSGSAAAVALGMCMAAIGSQTGGSITRPASYCGVAGLKPTFGRVSLEAIVPISFHLDHPGPIARYVSDLACLWQCIRIGANAEAYCPAAGTPLHPEEATENGSSWGRNTPPPKLGLVETFFMDRAEPAMREATRAAIDKLQGVGAEVQTVQLPESFADVHTMHRRIMATDAAEVHRQAFATHKDQYGPHVASMIEEGLALTAVDYAAALKHQQRFTREMARFLTGGIDALIMPATTDTAPARLDTTGDPLFNSPWSYAGLPVVSAACSLAANGMPCAVQLVGPPDQESRLLHIGAWCQDHFEFRQQPPMLDS